MIMTSHDLTIKYVEPLRLKYQSGEIMGEKMLGFDLFWGGNRQQFELFFSLLWVYFLPFHEKCW